MNIGRDISHYPSLLKKADIKKTEAEVLIFVKNSVHINGYRQWRLLLTSPEATLIQFAFDTIWSDEGKRCVLAYRTTSTEVQKSLPIHVNWQVR